MEQIHTQETFEMQGQTAAVSTPEKALPEKSNEINKERSGLPTSPIPPKALTATPSSSDMRRVGITTKPNQAQRLINPYPFPPSAPEIINAQARMALVNIICAGENSIQPVSGSGVFIDPRGIILTNAHVAQYVLLSEDPHVDLSCSIRSGSPAESRFRARVLYLPRSWVEEHADEINKSRIKGTGEHDYALLLITAGVDSPLPSTFPFIPIDAREAIAFTDDTVLTASYPAEFTGGLITQRELYAVSAWAHITELHTFRTGTVDAFSLSSTVGSQSGSSGGPVVNGWQRLVGIITTMSGGTATADRSLQAISLASISRDMQTDTGSTLEQFLTQNIEDLLERFEKIRSGLLNTLVAPLLKQPR